MITVGFENHRNDEKLQQDPIMHLHEIHLQTTKNAETDVSAKASAVAWLVRMEADENLAFAKWRKRHVLSVYKDAQRYARLIIAPDLHTGKNEVACKWHSGILAEHGKCLPHRERGRRNNFDFVTRNFQKAIPPKKGACSRSLLYRYLTIMKATRRYNFRTTKAARSGISKSTRSTK
jgi:hypothetical protein